MCAKHARILSLLEMSAVMLGTVGEVSVLVIQATRDTNVKNLVSLFLGRSRFYDLIFLHVKLRKLIMDYCLLEDNRCNDT